MKFLLVVCPTERNPKLANSHVPRSYLQRNPPPRAIKVVPAAGAGRTTEAPATS